jgi:hypothetical protein
MQLDETERNFELDFDYDISDALRQNTSTTRERAAAIWQLWEQVVKQDGEMKLEDFKYPRPTDVSKLLGVSDTTASNWIEPLRMEYADTRIDPRKDTDAADGLEDISPKKMRIVRTQLAAGDDAIDLLERIADEDLTIRDVKNAGKIETEDPEEAIQTVIETKQATADVDGYVLDGIHIGDELSDALNDAANDKNTTPQRVTREALESHLSLGGYI